jgi:hypothetical protein
MYGKDDPGAEKESACGAAGPTIMLHYLTIFVIVIFSQSSQNASTAWQSRAKHAYLRAATENNTRRMH